VVRGSDSAPGCRSAAKARTLYPPQGRVLCAENPSPQAHALAALRFTVVVRRSVCQGSLKRDLQGERARSAHPGSSPPRHAKSRIGCNSRAFGATPVCPCLKSKKATATTYPVGVRPRVFVLQECHPFPRRRLRSRPSRIRIRIRIRPSLPRAGARKHKQVEKRERLPLDAHPLKMRVVGAINSAATPETTTAVATSHIRDEQRDIFEGRLLVFTR
jgi:hypothetical protein